MPRKQEFFGISWLTNQEEKEWRGTEVELSGNMDQLVIRLQLDVFINMTDGNEFYKRDKLIFLNINMKVHYN